MERLQELENDGLVQLRPHWVRVTSRGRYLLRVVAMAFDAYLAQPQGVQRRYSRTV
jgi:oxygen-independent coproporphyrinogen-3 oxidase